jgi:hypothetical protein
MGLRAYPDVIDMANEADFITSEPREEFLVDGRAN